MRPHLIGLVMLALPVAVLAQSGSGGGMGGGGMGGGGGRGGGMGGGRGRGGEAGQSMGRPQGRRPEMKPVAREKMDKPVEEMFRLADVDKDGFVTLDELNAVLDARRAVVIRNRFKTIDKNGDKLIDEKEFIAWQSAMGSVALSDSEGGGGPYGIVAESLPPPLGKSDEDMVLQSIIESLSPTVLVNANSNYDKGVTIEELLAYEHKRFDAADTDKDGFLSGQELRGVGPNGRMRGGRGMRPADGDEAPPQSGEAPSD